MSPVLETTEPAIAAAMARCLTARAVSPDRPFTGRHPRRCGWCEWPTSELHDGLAAYNAWAAPTGQSHRSGRHTARVFAELPQDAQEALIVEAQAFPPIVEPEPAPEPHPIEVATVTPVIEEESAWQ